MTGPIVGFSTFDDGVYSARIREVLYTSSSRSSQTLRLSILARNSSEDGLGERSESRTDHAADEVLIPSSDLPADAEVGEVYALRIEDGTLVDATLDVAESRRRIASEIGDDKYAVPLRSLDHTYGTDSSRHVASLERNHSILLVGESGAGKTEFVRLLLPQIDAREDEPIVVFDYKDDLTDSFSDRRETVTLSLQDSDVVWNLFEEARAEPDYEELSRALSYSGEHTQTDLFFEKAAEQVFAGILKYLDREFAARDEQPSNRDLVEYVGMTDAETLQGAFEAHSDLRGLTSYVNATAEKQALGVLATLRRNVREVFVDDFAKEGWFSIREYMNDPQGRVLVLDFPIDRGESVKPAYRLFVDWAIRFGLSNDDRAAYFVLDEFARVPGLRRIGDLLSAGRSQNAQAIVGLQSLAQLEHGYGREATMSFLSGASQEVLMRCGDPRTVAYARDRLGKSFVGGRSTVAGPGDGGGRSSFPSGSPGPGPERYPISESAVQRFDDGEAIVLEPGDWFHGAFPMWHELDPSTRNVLRGDGDE